MKTEIRETRLRLATNLNRTADHVRALLTEPSAAQAEARDGGVLGGAATTIAVAGRCRAAWKDASRTGLLRRGGIVAATVALAAALAAMARRR